MVRTRLVQFGNKYFSGRQWPLVPYQPILYLFIFGAAIRLCIDQDPPPDFDLVIGNYFYILWLVLGLSGPMLALASWFMIRRSGRAGFVGLWVRFASDIMVFVNLISYHITVVNTLTSNETRIFSRYVVGSALLFTIFLIIRDLWTLVLVERMAGRIHRDG